MWKSLEGFILVILLHYFLLSIRSGEILMPLQCLKQCDAIILQFLWLVLLLNPFFLFTKIYFLAIFEMSQDLPLLMNRSSKIFKCIYLLYMAFGLSIYVMNYLCVLFVSLIPLPLKQIDHVCNSDHFFMMSEKRNSQDGWLWLNLS